MARRIQQRRARSWRKPAGAVAIGRPGFWGNPWGRDGATGRSFVTLEHHRGERVYLGRALGHAELVELHRRWLLGEPLPDVPERAAVAERNRAWREEILRRLPELRGRDLMCWCPVPGPCHGDILLALANGGGEG